MIKEFKEFIMRGNVMDMAIGIIIGVAFAAIVNSFVTDVLMPPIGLLLGNVDFSNLFAVLHEGTTAGPYGSLAQAQQAGAVTLNYGLFLNKIIVFLIIALALFIVVKAMNRMKKKAAPVESVTKDCPYCQTAVPVKAVRCPHCTSDIKGA